MKLIISENTEIILDDEVYLLESGDAIIAEEDTIEMSLRSGKVISHLIDAYSSFNNGDIDGTIMTLDTIEKIIPEDMIDDISAIRSEIVNPTGQDVNNMFDVLYKKWTELKNKRFGPR
jgi:hypothetical protein